MAHELISANELLVGQEGRLRILTLNRPDRMNALTPALHHALRDAVLAAAADADVGALVLTGAGRGFCAGGDVKRNPGDHHEPESIEDRADAIRMHGTTVKTLREMGKPSIALVNGAAAGSGLAIALACDIRIAMPEATLRTAYARVGLSGDLGISFFLTRIVGPSRATELMLLNDKLDAEAARALGLVSAIMTYEAGLALASALAAGPTLTFRYMKQNLRVAERGTLDAVIEQEAHNTARIVRTQDVNEAMAAFKEKRDPKFVGR
jgi:2-(1,2-epoxy-1,2-dihydrophenyl)acetyl-CoA isomerase